MFEDFVYFCRIQLATGDYDAHIPFLTQLSEDLGLSKEGAVQLGWLYMAYYNEASAFVAYKSGTWFWADLPIESQRRNFYNRMLLHKHLLSVQAVLPLVEKLEIVRDWEELLIFTESFPGNGRWASYTLSELLSHLAGLDFEPTTYEILQSSGPRKGLIDLGMEPTEASAAQVYDELTNQHGLVLQLSQLESLLCDWHGMCNGTFYAGRNIDRQQGRILKVGKLKNLGTDLGPLWVARLHSFPEWSLGELNRWEGIDRNRLKVYRDTGVVLRPEEKR